MMNISKELNHLYKIKYQLNQTIAALQAIVDAHEQAVMESSAAMKALEMNEVEDITTPSYVKAMCYQAFEQKMENALEGLVWDDLKD